MRRRCRAAAAIVAAAPLLAGCAPQRACWETPPTCPVDLVTADVFEDGGTAAVVFTDARGCEYRICLDGRESEIDAPRCLYLNAGYPTDVGALVLDPESGIGKAIHGALSKWLGRQLTEAQLKRLREVETVVGLTETEVRALRVLDVMAGFERKACAGRAP